MRRWVRISLSLSTVAAMLAASASCRQRAPDKPARPGARAPALPPVLPLPRPVMAVETRPSPLAPTPPGLAPWPGFRGTPDQRGIAPGELGSDFVRLWRFPTGGPVRSSPVIAEGKVFVGSDDGAVYAIDLASGKKVWAAMTGGSVSAAPLYAGRRIYVGSQDRTLYCLSAASGGLIWKFATAGEIRAAAAWAPDGPGPGRLDTFDGKILVGSYDFKLYCLRASDGGKLWELPTENSINGTPALAGGRVVFGGCDNAVYVVNLADGHVLTRLPTGGEMAYIPASAALDGAQAFVANYEGKLMRIDVAAGRIDWAMPLQESQEFCSAALTDALVLVGGGDGVLHCRDRRDGRKVWDFPTGGPIESSPVVVDGKVVFGSHDGRLYVLALADGRKLWSYDLGQAVASGPAVVDGKIIVGCDDGYVYAFGPAAKREHE
ncbi:MAG: PQQ-binding-like beta-propeller repeat protein [Planctomycetota bacterium]|nr:PQQ-binding-like beta-propeller repeat protein [Planctomycetota bacterium]